MAMNATLGRYQAAVDAALAEVRSQRIVERIWARDHTVWKPKPAEISNRLGWLDIADRLADGLSQVDALVESVRASGFTHAVLLGMGGSSLAPEVLRKTFGVRDGYPDLSIMDSTDPQAILDQTARLNLNKTLFIVSTKSGGTVETLSFFKYFFKHMVSAAGADHAGEHFIAITDPGSSLLGLAERFKFRDTFVNDPNIGGRYSALSYFGLVPGALCGADVRTLLQRAIDGAAGCKSGANLCPGVHLGVIIGELAKAGRDKITIICSPALANFGDWVEQLIAESTGKEAKGVLPVIGEPLGSPEVYADDRLFVYLRLEGDMTHEASVRALEVAGHPALRLSLSDRYDIGAQFFLWEMATAIAGYRLGINPFDQPNVEAAKILAREMVASYLNTGELPAMTPEFESDGIAVHTDLGGNTLRGALDALLRTARPGAYICVQAFIQPTPEAGAALQALRIRLRDRTHLATTAGYGPRFLHSTGQLHKGDAGKGLFIQLTDEDDCDADIPDEPGSKSSSMSFGVLKEAQALGDRQALIDAGRQIIRFDLGSDVIGGIETLTDAV
jgi:transaldolase/glucose-6-phosphate isomerase